MDLLNFLSLYAVLLQVHANLAFYRCLECLSTCYEFGPDYLIVLIVIVLFALLAIAFIAAAALFSVYMLRMLNSLLSPSLSQPSQEFSPLFTIPL